MSAGRAYGTPSAPSVDYIANLQANGQAAELIEFVGPRIDSLPYFADIGIVSSGVQISLTTSDPNLIGAIADIASAAPTDVSIPIHYRLVEHSSAQLQNITHQIDLAVGQWASKGVQLSAWGPSHESNTVLVRMSDYTPEAAQQLQDAYGSAITVYPGSVTAAGSDRVTDSQPWWGGDKITRSGVTCTSWFTVFDATAGYGTMLTAGHCGVGDWYNGFTNRGTVTSSRQKWTNLGNVDAERTDNTGNQAAYVWADPHVTSRTIHSVASYESYGDRLYTDGQTDREEGWVGIVDTDDSVSYDGKTILHQVYAEDADSNDAFSAGDSGGPVYSYTTGGNGADVKAYGMIVARVIGTESHGWFTPARNVIAAFSDTLQIKTT